MILGGRLYRICERLGLRIRLCEGQTNFLDYGWYGGPRLVEEERDRCYWGHGREGFCGVMSPI